MFAINTRGKNAKKALPPSRYEVESKFKSVLDLSSKLETLFNQAQSFRQLYTSSLLNLRERLCEEIKVLFRYAPIEYGRICEEILWKRNYYDYVKFVKKCRKKIDFTELAIFRMHLTSGIGHYQSLFISFRKTFNLKNLDDFLTFTSPKSSQIFKASNLINYNITDSKTDFLKYIFNEEEDASLDENNHIGNISEDDEEDAINELDIDYVQDEKFQPTLSFLVHRFCICLGDLARYYVDFFPKELGKSGEQRFSQYYFNIASFYYKSSSIIEPSLGMPFNQLGTLYTGSNWGLDSLYYYMRCLNSKKTFAGIKENMRQTGEVSRKALAIFNSKQACPTKSQNSSNDLAVQIVKESILRLTILFFELFNLKNAQENQAPLSIKKLNSLFDQTLSKVSLALNVEPSRVFSRSSPRFLSTENIFQIFSIFVMLIEQIKKTMKEESIEIKFEAIKLFNNDLVNNENLKNNFLLVASYRFIFQFFTLIICRETKLLRKGICNISPININTNKMKTSFQNVAKPKLEHSRKILATSFSSDFADTPEDSVMLNQLKSTAMQSIGALFDQSDNEDDEEVNGIPNKSDDSDSESVSELIDKTILSDDENGHMNGSVIDEAIDRIAAPLNNINNAQNNKSEAETITMDQLLAYIYTQSHTPVIKFFCDFLQSNGDFLDLFEHLDVLPSFFSAFFEYLNLVSELDLKLTLNFRHYISNCLNVNNQIDHKKVRSLIELNTMINKFSSENIAQFEQKHPFSSEIDYLHITEELSSYFTEQLFDLSSENNYQINLKPTYSCDQYGYICMRSIFVFGLKLALLSLNSNRFKLSLEGYDVNSIHNLSQKKPVKFIVTRVGPTSPINPFFNEDISKQVRKEPLNNEPLISFNDATDKEVESINRQANVRNKEKKKYVVNNINNNNNFDHKSLHALAKLPFVMIDPYVYLENLKFVIDLVAQKKAFLVVPKLATDFLDNLKKRNQNAKEASEFLFNEFFRGSRIIRFIRNDDRLELEMLNYPRFQWRRDMDLNDANGSEKMMNDMSKVKVQDLALFYELLEHCHYLLANKVLVDKSQEAMSLNGNSDEIRITLITNNLSKWPAAALDIARSYGIDIETMESFQEKQVNRNEKTFKQSKQKKTFKSAPQQSPMFFKPIHNPRAEIIVSNPLT